MTEFARVSTSLLAVLSGPLIDKPVIPVWVVIVELFATSPAGAVHGAP